MTSNITILATRKRPTLCNCGGPLVKLELINGDFGTPRAVFQFTCRKCGAAADPRKAARG
jgi:hypothetical protein